MQAFWMKDWSTSITCVQFMVFLQQWSTICLYGWFLGRAGHLQEAEGLINMMRCEYTNVAVWTALLEQCLQSLWEYGDERMCCKKGSWNWNLDTWRPMCCYWTSMLLAASGGISLQMLMTIEKGKRCEDTARLYLDWREWQGTHIWSLTIETIILLEWVTSMGNKGDCAHIWMTAGVHGRIQNSQQLHDAEGKRWPHLCYHQQDIFAMIFRLIRTPHDILQSAFSKTHVSAITATIPPMTEGWWTEHCFPLLHSILLSCLSLLSGSQDHEWISPSINKKRNSRHQRLICIIVCPIFR